MRMIVHRNVKTRPVKGGKKFVQTCPECGEHATFREVETTEKIGIFFALDLVTDTERGFQCSSCSEIFDLKEEAAAPVAPKAIAPKAAVPAPDPEEERRRRDEERRRQDERIEDELAALKKRLGR